MHCYLALINDKVLLISEFFVLHKMEDSTCPGDRNDIALEDSSSSLQIPTPLQIARVNFDAYTCKLGWSSHGDMCAVSTETRVHVYS